MFLKRLVFVHWGNIPDSEFEFGPISLAMKNWLNRSLPEKATERREVFRRLRKLKLIDYREEDDLDQAEAWVRIHPMIVDFVSA